MSTIELTEAVRRALVKGIDRLRPMDGNEADWKAADEVEKALTRAGYVTETSACVPVSEATGGYNAAGQHVYIDAEGEWVGDVKTGDTLYLDAECTTPLRIV